MIVNFIHGSKLKMIVSIFMVLFSVHAYTQSSVTGIVLDPTSTPLVGTSITIKEIPDAGSVTDFDGKFSISLTPGTYTLIASYLGFEDYIKKIVITDQKKLNLNIVLKENLNQLSDVVIVSKSNSQIAREQAYAVQSISTEGLKNTSVDISQILNTSSGVNVRQSGGLGSDTQFSLNGLTGNQVRIFIDGVPMDYFGSSLSLNNFPANLVSSIDTFKGVVPIHLSSDALGGAINIVTNKTAKNFLDASYSYGSFNTHRAALNGQYRDPNTGFMVRLKSFYNYSDNNYKNRVKLFDIATGREDDFYTDVERFHDAYESKMVWLETGLVKTKYLDELIIGVLYSDNFKEVQQNPSSLGTSKTPFGEVTTEDEKWIGNFSFKKNNLFTDKLNLSTYFTIVNSKETYKDIGNNRYFWDGTFDEGVYIGRGELDTNKSLFELDRLNILANINAEYEIAPHHNIAANYSLNQIRLEGEDTFSDAKNAQFGEPSTVRKQVTGVSYTNAAFNDKLKTTVFAKNYFYDLKAYTANQFTGDDREEFTDNQSHLGYGLASTYFFTDNIQIKASFEKTYRLPEAVELFGDGLSIFPAIDLNPEESDNFNIGTRADFNLTNTHQLKTDINLFLRDSKNFIRLERRGARGFYQNQQKVLTKGIDLGVQYNYTKKYFLSLNATYLDQRNNNSSARSQGGQEDFQRGQRIPNQPYLFGSGIATYRDKKLFSNHDTFSVSLINTYTHEFSFNFENTGDSNKPIIPSQFTNDIEVVYGLFNGKYNLSFNVVNIFDKLVYDNLNQQKAGRAFYIKARYFIN